MMLPMDRTWLVIDHILNQKIFQKKDTLPNQTLKRIKKRSTIARLCPILNTHR